MKLLINCNQTFSMAFAVGIDLGTTNSCVAVFRNGKSEIIKNEHRMSLTPSYVFHGEDETLVGKLAINESVVKLENAIFDVKRLIGRKFDDPDVQKNLKYWSFDVRNLEHGNEPLIKISRSQQELLLQPEEVYSEILKKLKEDTERSIKEKVRDVVITVPAYFTNLQKQATKHAAKIAGLNVLKLIPEPSAAVLTLTEENNKNIINQNILIYDLGAGTFDVSVVKFDENQGRVLTIDGDSYLGGRDFDNNLLEYFIDQISNIYNYKLNELGLSQKRRAIRRLLTQCEAIKWKLTQSREATLVMDEFGGRNVAINITREEFEGLNADLFDRTIKIVDDVLKRIKMEKCEIDDVILIGGSTRIPAIYERIQNYFDGKPPNKSINPDEAVAIGAAYLASTFLDVPNKLSCDLVDVTPFSLGVEVLDKQNRHKMDVIIKKDTIIPAKSEKEYVTIKDSQIEINLRIFEGEGSDVEQNTYLGELKISGITPKKAGKVKVIVCLHVSSDGMLTVTATETSKYITKDLEINYNINLKKSNV